MKKTIATVEAPAAVGPYSQAVLASGTLYVSGQLGLDPKTGTLKGDDVKSQAVQALENLVAILREAGFSATDVVKTTVFLSDISLFQQFNEVYATVFKGEALPARSCVAVKALPKNALVEIEAIAVK